MATRMQQRRGTAAQWISINDSKGPILNAGEIGFESDSGKFKIGDGINHWVDLNYFVDQNSISGSLGDYVLLSTLGQPDGVATLGSDGKLDSGQLPDVALVTVHAVADSGARLALSVEPGDIAIQSNTGATYVLTTSPASVDANWTMITVSDPFPTHDTDDLAEGTTNKYFTNQRALDATSAAYDPAGSAASAEAAAKGYADTKVSDLVGSAPAVLNTLGELATAIAEDQEFSVTILEAISLGVNSAKDYAVAQDVLVTGDLVDQIDSAKTSAVGIAATDATAKADAAQAAAISAAALDATTKSDAAKTAAIASAVATAATDATAKADAAQAAAIDSAALDATTKVNAAKDLVAQNLASHADDTTNIHGIADTAALATMTYVETEVLAGMSSEAIARNTAIDDAIVVALSDAAADATTKAANAKNDAIDSASTALLAHADDTTNIHGIVDTSALATKTYADDAVSTHNSDTTSVHGIADTAALATKTYADDAADAAQAAAEGYAKTYADGLATNYDAVGSATTALNSAKSYTDTKVADVISSAPGALDTLNELAAALGNDANYAATVTSALALKAPLASPTFTGTVVLPSGTVTSAMIADGAIVNADINASAAIAVTKLAPSATNGQLLTTVAGAPAWADAPVSLPTQTGYAGKFLTTNGSVASWATVDLTTKADLASPTFTGTPAAPTASADTSTTQLATTAFVVGQAASTTPVADATSGVVGTSLKFARADHVHPLPSNLNILNGTSTWNSGSTAPTGTTRLNYEGYLYATRVYNAVFNDYAEYFEKEDMTLEHGDVVAINPETGKYVKSSKNADTFVVGVYSDEFAQCIGGLGDGNDEENFASVGMAGRVNVKVTGKVSVGDLLIASDIPGVAASGYAPGAVIGKALENHEGSSVDRIRMLILAC